MNTLSMFRALTDEEIKAHVKWARDNYKPGQPIDELWHPATRLECEAMNLAAVQGWQRVVPD